MNIDFQTLYVIDQKESLGLEFSKLVSMMNYTRQTTFEAVKDLTVEELDYLFDEDANSIGMLLAHMASVEKAYQIVTFENRDLTDEEEDALNPALDLGKNARERITGNSLEYYLEQLEKVRSVTIETFKTLPDEWLFEQAPFWWNHPANNYFKWFHVFEDELSHRGQIRLIKKMFRSVRN